MNSLKQFLQEMKVVKGTRDTFYYVSTWAELDRVLGIVERQVKERKMETAGDSPRMVRALFDGAKIIVWSGWYGSIHGTAAHDLGLDFDRESLIDVYIEHTPGVSVKVYCGWQELPIHRIVRQLDKLLHGCPDRVDVR